MKGHTSLVGKGVEILFGQTQEEPPLRPPRAKPPSLAGALPAVSPGVKGDVEEALAAEWASWQKAQPVHEALQSALGEDASAVSAGAGIRGALAPSAPYATRERAAGLVEDPARQSRLMTSQASRAQMLALTQAGERARMHTRGIAAPAGSSGSQAAVTADLPEETMPSPMYVEAHIDSQESSGQTSTPDIAPKRPSTAVDSEPIGSPDRASTAPVADEQLEPEGPKTPELSLGDVETHEEEQPSRARTEEEAINNVAPEQRQALWNEIMELYEIVPNLLCTDENLSDALRLLQEAQDILLEKPRQFDAAKYKVGQVSGIVNRRLNTSRWANTYGWAAFVYEMLWIGVLVLAVFFSPVAVQFIVSTSEGALTIDPSALSVLWNTMAWGGLGGVLGAFYSLYWHAAKKKDFDKQYMMWYTVQPVIGLLVGGLIHLLFGAGFLTAVSKASTTTGVVLSALPYAVACIAAFRQRFILEIIDQVIQLVTPKSTEAKQQSRESDSSASPSTPVGQ